tara:strand:- start:6155 stop:7858 length:1704 start_codon:yes stop_codon:yes gene_type:complete
MFQNPNIRRSEPGGIMASSPELIRVSTANASPLNKTFNIPPLDMKNIPGVASASKDREGNFLFPQVVSFSTEDIDPKAEKTKLEQLKDMAATEKKLATDTAKEKSSKIVDDYKKDINETNKKLLNTKPTDDVEDISEDVDTTLRTETKTDTNIQDFDFSPTKQGMEKVANEIQTLYKNFSTDMSNLGNRDLFGTTMNKAVEQYREALNKKPKELDFADVKDDVFELLGYNRDTLDENLSKDQQSAIWLNVMRAGLAVAAGESENALTNVAKGFGIGLEGYGRDMKDLTDDYREDVKTYTTTAYTMLKDAKAEELAKNTLNLQRAGAEFQITSQFFGQERENLLNQLNREVAGRMLKMNHLKAFADMDFEKFKFKVSADQAEKANEIAFQKLKMMEEPLIQGAIIDGYIELIDPNKPATSDNLKPTQKFKDSGRSLLDVLSKKNITRITDTQETRGILGDLGGYGIVYDSDKTMPENVKKAIGQKIKELGTSGSIYKKAMDPSDPQYATALSQIIGAFKSLQKFDGVKLDFNLLDEDIKNELRTAAEGDPILEIFNRNRSLFSDINLN